MERKWRNFKMYQRLHPSCRFVFIGDSGQLDAEFASRMLDSGHLQMALIHRIYPPRSSLWEQPYAQQGVLFFDTFVEAARLALAAGLLSSGDARRVMDSALSEISTLDSANL